jgi:hypothetical protein
MRNNKNSSRVTRKNKSPQNHKLNLFITCESVATVTKGNVLPVIQCLWIVRNRLSRSESLSSDLCGDKSSETPAISELVKDN